MPDTAEASTESWTENFSDEHKEALSGFESQDKLFEAINYEAPKDVESPDWRDGLEGDEKKTADRFASPGDMVRSIQESRKRESLTRVPGKDATKEEMSTYLKAIGVPETPAGYVFNLPEGETSTPEIEASNKQWGERLHGLNVPTETVNKLLGYMKEDSAAYQEAEINADTEFVAQSLAALKSEWKGEEYGKNVDVANQAFKVGADRAGINLEVLTNMKTEDGRLLMDHPIMLRMFAVFGREMSEGSLGPSLTDGERDTMQDQLTALRGKIEAANLAGNSKDANRYYQDEQKLISRMDGNKSIKQ